MYSTPKKTTLEVLDYETTHNSIEVVFEISGVRKELTFNAEDLDGLVYAIDCDIYDGCTVRQVVTDMIGESGGYCDVANVFDASIFLTYDFHSDMLPAMIESHYKAVDQLNADALTAKLEDSIALIA